MNSLTHIFDWQSSLAFGHGSVDLGSHEFVNLMSTQQGGIVQLAVVGLTLFLMVRMFRNPASPLGPDSPRDYLARSYAAGETHETHRTMKNDIRNDTPR